MNLVKSKDGTVYNSNPNGGEILMTKYNNIRIQDPEYLHFFLNQSK